MYHAVGVLGVDVVLNSHTAVLLKLRRGDLHEIRNLGLMAFSVSLTYQREEGCCVSHSLI